MFKNKEGKVRSGWKIAAMLGSALGVSMLIGIIVGMSAAAILLMNGDLNAQTMEYTEHGNQILANVNLIMMFLQDIVMILTAIIAWKFIIKRPLSNMGLTSIKTQRKEFIVGLLFGILSISVVFIVLVLSGNAEVKSWAPHFSVYQLIYLLLFILVGFAEEIVGRGFIMSALRQTRNIPVVIIVSSIIFALMHSFNSGIGIIPYINLTLVGIFFSYMYLKSGNIWMCIGYHITWNYFQGNVFGFKVSGTETYGILTTQYEKANIFNGGDFGPEGGLFVTAVILLGFLFVKIYYKNCDYNFLSSEPVIMEQPPLPEVINYNTPM